MPWELDDTQREAVESPDRAVMVVAGPGTGKTRVLTARAAYLTETIGVSPGRILAITYTNRAAAEMRGRLLAKRYHSASGEEIGISPAGEVRVSTFHSWAYRLVRNHYHALGFPREPVVFDEDAEENLLRLILARERISEEFLPIRYLKQLLDRVKAVVAYPLMDERFDPEHYEVVAGIFRIYDEELKARAAIDFNDILLGALELLYLHPDVREEVLSGIDHLLIDEFQDLNPAQYRLICALENPDLNVFAVGDEDQTIYAFRGSSGVYIDTFVADFNATLIPLGGSYRCSPGILYAASKVIGNNTRFYQRPPKPPEGMKEKPPIGVFEVENEDEEARIIAKLVRGWAGGGCDYRDMAILYRVHWIADECESFLINSGVPVMRLHPDRQREEIPGDPLPLLRLAGTDSEWDWDRALGLPRDRLGELDDLRVRLIAAKEGVPLYKLLGRPSRFRNLSALAQSQLAKLSRFVRSLRKKAGEEAPSAMVNYVAEHLSETMSPWNAAEDAFIASEHETITGFNEMSPGSILDEWRESKDGIRIYHAPTITAFLAAHMLEHACRDIIGIEAERIPQPFEWDEDTSYPVDNRPVVSIGLNYPGRLFFPADVLIPRVMYLTGDGFSESPSDECKNRECFELVISTHLFVTKLVGYRPGGSEDEVIVFFDLETTGTDTFRSEIVEIAAVRVLLRDGKVKEAGTFEQLVKPDYPIPQSATDVHGIDDDDVKEAPPIAEVLPRFLEFIGDSPLAGHNIDSFDLPLIRRHTGHVLNEIIPNLSIDTLPLSRRLFPGEPHRLESLADKFGIDKGRAHRALDDVRTNIEVFTRLVRIDESLRARAFSIDLPFIFALAHAVDDSTEADGGHYRASATRQLAAFDDDMEDHPFVKAISEGLSESGLSTIKWELSSLGRSRTEYIPHETYLVERINLLREEALRLEDDRSDVTLGDFLSHMVLLTESDFDSDEDAVRMMTLHAAKGLEFDRVIILGLEQGDLPHRLALNKTASEIEEERRLFYVGLTRARDRAALFCCRRRHGRWRPKSMFLGELPSGSFKNYKTKDKIKQT